MLEQETKELINSIEDRQMLEILIATFESSNKAITCFMENIKESFDTQHKTTEETIKFAKERLENM